MGAFEVRYFNNAFGVAFIAFQVATKVSKVQKKKKKVVANHLMPAVAKSMACVATGEV